jgi:hypothetical protein
VSARTPALLQVMPFDAWPVGSKGPRLALLLQRSHLLGPDPVATLWLAVLSPYCCCVWLCKPLQ